MKVFALAIGLSATVFACWASSPAGMLVFALGWASCWSFIAYRRMRR